MRGVRAHVRKAWAPVGVGNASIQAISPESTDTHEEVSTSQ